MNGTWGALWFAVFSLAFSIFALAYSLYFR